MTGCDCKTTTEALKFLFQSNDNPTERGCTRKIVAMSALTAGVQYSLSSNQNNGLMPKQRTGKNKTLFFVKLTDSCLKAVEDYLRCCQQVSTDRASCASERTELSSHIWSPGQRTYAFFTEGLFTRTPSRCLRDFSRSRAPSGGYFFSHVLNPDDFCARYLLHLFHVHPGPRNRRSVYLGMPVP